MEWRGSVIKEGQKNKGRLTSGAGGENTGKSRKSARMESKKNAGK